MFEQKELDFLELEEDEFDTVLAINIDKRRFQLKKISTRGDSIDCKNKGRILWKNELKRRKDILINPINIIIRELENYNKKLENLNVQKEILINF